MSIGYSAFSFASKAYNKANGNTSVFKFTKGKGSGAKDYMMVSRDGVLLMDHLENTWSQENLVPYVSSCLSDKVKSFTVQFDHGFFEC